jgi:hypothetical protein
VPHRAALAIKVENHPDARPQAGLNDTDIVVEEPVEGGYTRFIAIFQCGDSDRVGPVRSGRTTDPDYLRQLGPTLFAYAGAVGQIEREVPEVGLTDVNYEVATGAYQRDETREAPHNVYTTTAALWKAGKTKVGAPEPMFTREVRRSVEEGGRPPPPTPGSRTSTGDGAAARPCGCARMATYPTWSRVANRSRRRPSSSRSCR